MRRIFITVVLMVIDLGVWGRLRDTVKKNKPSSVANAALASSFIVWTASQGFIALQVCGSESICTQGQQADVGRPLQT